MLHANLNLLKTFTNSVSSPILILHQEDLEIIHMNSWAEDLLGYSEREKKNIDFLSLFPKDELHVIHNLLILSYKVKEHHSLREVHRTIKKKSGKKVFVNMNLSRMYCCEKSLLIFSFENLTEIKKLEQQKKDLDLELSRVSKLADMSRLSAGIAHELNNPLAIIQGYAENIQILAEEGPINPHELMAEIDHILKTVQRMSHVIEKMMSMMRGEGPQLERVLAKDLLTNLLLIFDAQWDPYQITKTFHIDEKLEMMCESTKIEQVIINIINNAIHALEKKELPRILEIRSYEHNHRIFIEIYNNGAAIPKEVEDKLFTPFFTTKVVGEGVGLGLFLSYNIMKAHGGNLSFQSETGWGTKFILEFPKLLNHQNILLPEKEKILIIDDESFFRQILSKKISTHGFKVLSARNAKDAFHLLKIHPEITTLFTDYKMPDISGIDLIKQIYEFRPDMMFFILTGYTGAVYEESKNLPIQSVIKKPLVEADLMKCIDLIKNKNQTQTKVS